MKTRRITMLVSLLIIILITGSCRKEQLLRNEGKWTIESVDYTMVSQVLPALNQVVKEGTTNNAGTFTFNNDGTGEYDFTIENIRHKDSFDWNVKYGKVYIKRTVYIMNVDTNAYNNVQNIDLKGTREGKNKFDFSGTFVSQIVNTSSNGMIKQYVFDGTFHLKQ